MQRIAMVAGGYSMTQDDQTQDQPSLYDRLGGVYRVATVVDDFINRIKVDPRLNANPRVDEAHHRVPPAGARAREPGAAVAPPSTEELLVVYDGQCPFCANYAAAVRLRARGIAVRLHDAREAATWEAYPGIAHFDLDAGMLARWRGVWRHGDAAVRLISTLCRDAPFAGLLRRPRLARLAYPLLRLGRRAALSLRGSPRLGHGSAGKARL